MGYLSVLIGLALAESAAGFRPSAALRLGASADARHAAVSMGRAERRLADKQNKKSGGKPTRGPTQAGRGRNDVLLRTDVLARLAEVSSGNLRPRCLEWRALAELSQCRGLAPERE